MNLEILKQIAEELSLPMKGVSAVVQLLNEGNTIPFIARYRKEATNGLDEVQIRSIQDRLTYLIELEDRKKSILESIQSQGKLTDDLKAQIINCQSKTTLEDLYLPYKPKRRTKASIAREKGLEPLALRIISQPLDGNLLTEAAAFINAEKEVASAEDAIAGALEIVAETVAERADVEPLYANATKKKAWLFPKSSRAKMLSQLNLNYIITSRKKFLKFLLIATWRSEEVKKKKFLTLI